MKHAVGTGASADAGARALGESAKVLSPIDTWSLRTTPSPPSVLDLPRSFPLYGTAHGLQLLRRMTDPIDKLTDDAQRFAATE